MFVENINLPHGIYLGIWSGTTVTIIQAPYQDYYFKTSVGIIGTCRVLVRVDMNGVAKVNNDDEYPSNYDDEYTSNYNQS